MVGVERGEWRSGRESGRIEKTVGTGRYDEDLLVFFECGRL